VLKLPEDLRRDVQSEQGEEAPCRGGRKIARSGDQSGLGAFPAIIPPGNPGAILIADRDGPGHGVGSGRRHEPAIPEKLQIDLDVHSTRAGGREGKPGREFKDLRKPIKQVEIVDVFRWDPSGYRGPGRREVSPVASDREIVDEQAALVKAPDFDLI